MSKDNKPLIRKRLFSFEKAGARVKCRRMEMVAKSVYCACTSQRSEIGETIIAILLENLHTTVEQLHPRLVKNSI